MTSCTAKLDYPLVKNIFVSRSLFKLSGVVELHNVLQRGPQPLVYGLVLGYSLFGIGPWKWWAHL